MSLFTSLLWPRHSVCWFSGGGSPTIEQQPIPTPAPPVTSDSQQVLQAQQQLAGKLAQRKTVKGTIYAGDVATIRLLGVWPGAFFGGEHGVQDLSHAQGRET